MRELRRVFSSVFGGVVGFSLFLSAGCSASHSGAGPQATKNNSQVPINATRDMCQKRVSLAYQDLNTGKQQQSASSKYIAWDKVEFELAEAVAAQQNRDYDACVKHADFVIQYTDRSANFAAWQKSMNGKSKTVAAK